MGQCCGGQETINLNDIIKTQSLARRWLAQQKLAVRRREELTKIAVQKKLAVIDGRRASIGSDMITERQLALFEAEQPNKRIFIAYSEQVDSQLGEMGSKMYRGQWRMIQGRLQRDGIGMMKWADGSEYRGQWREDAMSGVGQMVQPNGDVYQGTWLDSMANGQGVFVDSLGSTYEGDWRDDLQHGNGRETWEDGRIRFAGVYVEGRKEGPGRYDWADGSYFEGAFVDSAFEGQGSYYFAESEKLYEGTFRGNLFEGKGKLTFHDGRVYVGDFLANKRHGQGTMTFANGNKYIGAWREEVQHGVGIYLNAAEGTKKQGEWANGKRTKWLDNPLR